MLSSSVKEALAYLDEDLDDLLELPPLPADYSPSSIEVLFEGVSVYCFENGRETRHLSFPPAYRPNTIEYAFDGIAVFLVVGDFIVLNRLENIANLDNLNSVMSGVYTVRATTNEFNTG